MLAMSQIFTGTTAGNEGARYGRYRKTGAPGLLQTLLTACRRGTCTAAAALALIAGRQAVR
jgi:hypothetical protein